MSPLFGSLQALALALLIYPVPRFNWVFVGEGVWVGVIVGVSVIEGLVVISVGCVGIANVAVAVCVEIETVAVGVLVEGGSGAKIFGIPQYESAIMPKSRSAPPKTRSSRI